MNGRSVPSRVIGAAVAVVAVGAIALGLSLAGSGNGGVSATTSPTSPSALAAALGSTTPSPPPSPGAPLPGSNPGTASPAPAPAPALATTPTPATSGPATKGAAAPTAPSHRTLVPTTTGAAPVASGPVPPAPGTYRYRQAGSLPGTPAEGTLVVAARAGPGTQTWTRVVGGPVAPATTTMLFNGRGSFLLAPGGTGIGAPASCSFATPLPWPPWPTTVGASMSGQATCGGPVSSYQVAESIPATTAQPFAGATVNAAIVVTTIVITGTYNGSPLRVSMTETDYYAPALRIPIVTKTHLVGTVLGLSVTTDRTDTLESATPA